MGSGHKVAGRRTLGALGPVPPHQWAESGPPRPWGLFLTHWQVKTEPGVSASLLAGRVDSWSLVIRPMSPRAFFRLLGCGVPDTAGCEVWNVLKVVLAC